MLALVSSPPLPSPFPSGLPPVTHLGEHPLLSRLFLSSPPNSPLLTHTLPGKSCCQTVLLRLLLHSPGWWSPLPASSCDPYSACPPLWYFLGNYWTPANYFIWRFGSTEYYCLLHPILDDNLPFFLVGITFCQHWPRLVALGHVWWVLPLWGLAFRLHMACLGWPAN